MLMRQRLQNFGSVVRKYARSVTSFWSWWRRVSVPELCLTDKSIEAKAVLPGEFGHMTIGTGAPVACAAGSTECWEAFASERAALARYKKLSHNNGNNDIDFTKLMDLALKGEGNARGALKTDSSLPGNRHREFDSGFSSGNSNSRRSNRARLAGHRRGSQGIGGNKHLSRSPIYPNHLVRHWGLSRR